MDRNRGAIYALAVRWPDALSGFDLANDRNSAAPLMRRPLGSGTGWVCELSACAVAALLCFGGRLWRGLPSGRRWCAEEEVLANKWC